MKLFHLLNLDQIITDTFEGVQAALVGIMAICCIIMIIAILASPPNTGDGQNVITGASESYYTKNKGKNNQGRIRNLIIICASIITLCAILYFVAYGVYPGEA
jgi:preprotein translocase subunit SecG